MNQSFEHTSEQRNNGIDLLRILVTIMVIVLHLLLYGGYQENLTPLSPHYNFFWLLGTLADCAVNCFALISGYVSYSKRFKYTNILRLHLIVLFHNITLTILISAAFPSIGYGFSLTEALHPLIANTYWYYTTYVLLFFLMPLLNYLMEKMSKKLANIMILSAIILFSILPTFFNMDLFFVNKGFSLSWLALAYFIGTYLKKYENSFARKKLHLTFFYFGCSIAAWFTKLLVELYIFKTGNQIFDTSRLTDYCSPAILFAAVSLVLLFSNLQIPAWKVKVLSFCVPLSFSVYIIHQHPYVHSLLVQDRFIHILNLPILVQFVIVILSALLIWILCTCLDWVRKGIFQFLGIEKALQKIEQKLSAALRRPKHTT